MRERDLLKKDVVESDGLASVNDDRLKTLENERTKLKHKQEGLKNEAGRLQKSIWSLD
jgi:hypothetical protein